MRSSLISIHSLLLLLSCIDIIFAAPASQPGSNQSITKRNSDEYEVKKHDKPSHGSMISQRSTSINAVNNIQKRTKKGTANKKKTKPSQQKTATAAKNKSKGTPQKKPKKTTQGGSPASGGACPLRRPGAGSKKKKKASTKKPKKSKAQGHSNQVSTKKQKKPKAQGQSNQASTKKPKKSKGRQGLKLRKRSSVPSCPPEQTLWGGSSVEVEMSELDTQDLGGGRYIGTSGLNGCTAVVVKSNSAALVAHVSPPDSTHPLKPTATDIANQIQASQDKFPTDEIKVLFYAPRNPQRDTECARYAERMKRELPQLLGIQATAIRTELYDEVDDPGATAVDTASDDAGSNADSDNDEDIDVDDGPMGTMLIVMPSGRINLGHEWGNYVDL